MRFFIVIIAIAALSGIASCKGVEKKTVKPKNPPETVELQVLGGWKMGLPGPGENILQFAKKAPVTLGPESKMIPDDGSVSYVFEPLFYADCVANAFHKVFKVHPKKWDYNHISMATLFSFAFFITEAVDATLVSIKIDVDATLSLESAVVYHKDYTVTYFLPFEPGDNGYPSQEVISRLYREALEVLAGYFEADPQWLQKLE
ncbi:MAG: hypothetical protein A2Y33_00975 [Spirochaetes bacterium GWF1_51_8]|nr:MAG: hypothetical protein A2Y33_00975 [Spirochaetes bacterium GWF1_51_8]